MLQPFDYDPNEKNKHKFMVQTMFAPDTPVESTETLVSIFARLLSLTVKVSKFGKSTVFASILG